MSPEAPKQTGVKPDGCLPGFLRRLVRQPTPPPAPGLETFTSALQQKIDTHLAAQRQQAIDQQRAQAVAQAARAEEQARELQRQRELEKQAEIIENAAARETARVLEQFQIIDRLRIIQKTVWGGEGQIRPTIYGIELIYPYSSYTREGEGNLCSGRWRYIPMLDSTRIVVSVRFFGGTGELIIKSFEREGWEHFAAETVIPVDIKDSITLLEAALTKEASDRISNQTLPCQLKKRAREERLKLPHWQKWIHYYNPNYDPSS